ITASTFSGNSTSSAGDGGGVWYSGPGTATVVNSTFNGNSIESGIGGAFFLSSVTATLTNDTIAGNTVKMGSRGENPGISGAAGVTANNTIISDPPATDDCDATVASSDHSLQSS